MKETIYTCNKCGKKQDFSMEELDCCVGYKTSTDSVTYEPFEMPVKGKVHLCEKCYLEWSKMTCLFVYPGSLQLHKDDRKQR